MRSEALGRDPVPRSDAPDRGRRADSTRAQVCSRQYRGECRPKSPRYVVVSRPATRCTWPTGGGAGARRGIASLLHLRAQGRFGSSGVSSPLFHEPGARSMAPMGSIPALPGAPRALRTLRPYATSQVRRSSARSPSARSRPAAGGVVVPAVVPVELVTVAFNRKPCVALPSRPDQCGRLPSVTCGITR